MSGRARRFATARSPTSGSARGRSPGKPPAWSGLGAVAQGAASGGSKDSGVNVIAHDPYNDEARHSLDELLAEADIVSLHAPVTDETVGMIGAAQFAAMRDGVVFLNTARAQLHDTDALVDALRSGKVAAAGLDHFDGEWLPTDHPLTSMPNVVLTPHIGGATWNTEARQAQIVADGLEALLSGRHAHAHRQPGGARRR